MIYKLAFRYFLLYFIVCIFFSNSNRDYTSLLTTSPAIIESWSRQPASINYGDIIMVIIIISYASFRLKNKARLRLRVALALAKVISIFVKRVLIMQYIIVIEK